MTHLCQALVLIGNGAEAFGHWDTPVVQPAPTVVRRGYRLAVQETA
jgi:hypothetical protein